MSGRGVLAAFFVAVLAVAGSAVPADGHEVRSITKGAVFMQGSMAGNPFTEGQPIDQPARDAALRGPAGPCTEAVANGMPEGAGHDHTKPEQHQGLACRIEQVASDSLKDELEGSSPLDSFPADSVLGEMDVKADIAAIAVTYPNAGILFFDVSDPSSPAFLSSYKGRACDAQPIDINCGAFADLSADGKVAFLSVQNLSGIPSVPPSGAPGTPGIEVIDISDPENPLPTQAYGTSTGLTGVHTSRAHVIPEGPEGDGRAPGEYVFANRNSFGVTIGEVIRPGGVPQIVPVSEIDSPGLHDTFIQEDPLTGRTYIYLADGFDTGFKMYDVTNPAEPQFLGQWDLTPQCSEDWYAHTIDVTTSGGKRYVTLPVEVFDGGETSDEEVANGCNAKAGSSDRAGPMWIVDATDPKALAQEGEAEASEKQKSEASLVTTWTNPAGRAGGNLTFTPHNQQIVGHKIYLSDYHGGVIVLDASKAFDCVREPADAERSREVAFKVPEVTDQRPIIGPVGSLIPFFTDFPLGRPEVWDMVFYKGHILTQDMTGGFYSLKETQEEPPASTANCAPNATGSDTGGASGTASGTAPAIAARCSTARGRLRPRNIGAARLGRTRTAQRRGFVRTARRRALVDRFCLTDGTYIRVGYASRAASRSGAKPRPRLRGKTIIALTASKRYAIRGVNAGDSVGTMRRRIKGISRPYRIGPNTWYLAEGSSSRLIFRVRGGRVREIGVADLGVTQKRRPTRRLLRLFDTN